MKNESCRYDIAGLARELEVEIAEIVPLFMNYVNEMKSEIADMHKCLFEGDLKMLQRIVHNIKGVSANLGIFDMFEEASVLNEMLKQGGDFDLSGHVGGIAAVFQNTEIEIRKFFIQNGYAL